VSRLVLLAFIGEPAVPGAHAAHNDGNPANNRLANLRWATALENQADVDRHGNRVRGADVFGAKLTEEDVVSIMRRIAAGEKYPGIASEFNVSTSTISLIKHKRIWKHVKL
jgi:DNA-binding NarL/FixJ family response regulator